LQSDSVYKVPRRDGGLMIGASVEQAGFDQRVTVGAIQALLSWAMRSVPALRDASIGQMWAGLRPRAADDLPILGPVAGCDGLYIATGHFRNGILLAPITAQLVTEWLGGSAPAMDVAPFSPDRWRSVG
jgi:glycine oxidase